MKSDTKVTMASDKKIKRNIKPFNGEHYSIWKFRLRALISEEDALLVLDQDPPETITNEWQKLDRTAKGCIIEHLSDSMIGIVTEELTARDIMQKLDSIYERKSLATQLSVQKKLLSFKLKAETSLIKHFIEFDEMMIELTAAGANLNEMGKVAHLLLTLPSSYDGVVTAIQTLSDDNLSLAFVKTRLLDHEIKIKNESNDTSTKVLNAYTKNTNKGNNSQKNWTSQERKPHRGYNQETKQFRFKTHNKKSNKSYTVKCDHCGRKNHTKRDCFYYKKIGNKNYNTSRNEKNLQMIQTADSQNFAFMMKSTPLQNKSGSPDDIIFILDSGATDHIINQSTVFTTYEELENPIKITVAKEGESIFATLKGTINITTNQGFNGTIKDVLYAPEVPYNLLSVCRIQEAGMTVVFDKNGEVSIFQGSNTIIKGKILYK